MEQKTQVSTLNYKVYYIRHFRFLEHWNVAALDQLPSFFVFASVHIRFFVWKNSFFEHPYCQKSLTRVLVYPLTSSFARLRKIDIFFYPAWQCTCVRTPSCHPQTLAEKYAIALPYGKAMHMYPHGECHLQTSGTERCYCHITCSSRRESMRRSSGTI